VDAWIGKSELSAPLYEAVCHRRDFESEISDFFLSLRPYNKIHTVTFHEYVVVSMSAFIYSAVPRLINFGCYRA